VRDPPPGIVIPPGIGDFCQLMVLVISQRPGLCMDCAQAIAVRSTKHINVIRTGVLRMKSPC
jgi:hypothetical protein